MKLPKNNELCPNAKKYGYCWSCGCSGLEKDFTPCERKTIRHTQCVSKEFVITNQNPINYEIVYEKLERMGLLKKGKT